MAESLPALFEACVQTYTYGSIKQVEPLVLAYNGGDWKSHCILPDQPFKKHTLFCNAAFEAILIQWKAGFTTDFHAHPSNGCILRVLDGTLEETVKHSTDCVPEETVSIYSTTVVSYMHDSKGVHKIKALTDATSLHIYAPPGFYN
jgi:hypothetical protein